MPVSNTMKKRMILFAAVPLVLVALIPVWVVSTRSSARLDLTNMDDLLMAEKWIGLVPASKEIHADAVGFVDQTIFYDATVTPSEVGWLDPKFEQTSLQTPGGSPLWWRLCIWWDALHGDMKYYSSDSGTSARFAYSQRKKIVYGYFDLP
jgi:hypothetical protein